jgi:hypothetical protein
MGTRSKEGLAALCLVANGFKADNFTAERLRDGRITEVSYRFEDGKHVVRIFSGGASDFYAKGSSSLDERDARAQAEQSFWCWELEQAAMRPGDAVRVEGVEHQCF